MNIEEVKYMRVVYKFSENKQPAAFKVKNTLRRCIQGSKTRNNLQRRYLQIKNEEAAYESQMQNAKNTVAAMSLENETSQVRYG